MMSKSWADGTVTTNGIRLHYYRTGGDKPPIVMSHGITDSGLCWRRIAEVLEADYDVVMVDARGHGLSEKPEREYSREEHARDLAGLIRILALDPTAVIGHSMGGSIATVLAATEPALVRCAVLEDPPWRSLTEIEVGASAEEWAKQIADRKRMPEAKLIETGKTTNPTWSEAEFGDWSKAKQQVSGCGWSRRSRGSVPFGVSATGCSAFQE
jgi:pimeloyl-ACP methyl ester carboxylesterase